MSMGFLKYCKLAYLSGPRCERTIYREISKRKPKTILEIGLGLGVRTLRMLEVASRYHQPKDIHYTGIDRFDARDPDMASLTIKHAYKLLKRNANQIKLVPGDALAAMTQTANAAANTDLIVIDADILDRDLEQAWRYFPRMMHENTLVIRQHFDDQGKYIERLTIKKICELEKSGTNRQAA